MRLKYYLLTCIIIMFLVTAACNALPTTTTSPPISTNRPYITTPIKTPITTTQNPNATVLSTTSGTITPGNSSNLGITLLVGQILKGNLVLTNGIPINGLELNIQQPDGKVVSLGTQNTNQRQFEFTASQNGTHFIIMRNPGPWTSVDYTLSYNIVSPLPSPSPTISPASKLEVYYLDVGQGDSEILRVDNSTMLIDAGINASTNTLISDIKKLGINKFDVVIGTHPHEDHIGGMDAVVNQFSIGKLYMPRVSANTKTFEDVLKAIQSKGLSITTPAPGDTFTMGSDTCTILAPNSLSYTDLNNYSIVIRVVHGKNSFLFTGDAQSESEKEMLTKGYTLKSEVLKVGHHGSSSSTSPGFLKAVSPKYAVIEVGKDNDYGYPHQVTLDKLNSAGIKIYRTDLNGTVSISSDGSNITVSTEK
jgi:beta-lactamase superfamily II metal-dependent hydrolase